VQALLETRGLHSVYSGHDHGNSWCGTWGGEQENKKETTSRPLLCFCKHTGYGGYGEWKRGSRTVDLKFGEERSDAGRRMEVESWVRMESGEVIQKVGLNETYGIDIYPEDDGEESKKGLKRRWIGEN